MTNILPESSETNGSLVAFEGPQDTISTQLRLLPNSPNILILPPVEHFAKETNPNSAFDARLQILRIHDACDARAEVAREFLRESTPDSKKLVFMNGGTASAQLSCISAICKHETNGDSIGAEILFNELIQNGIAGLKRQCKSERGAGIASKSDGTRGADVLDDPISKAMRAADALDLETAFLQDNNELDLTTASRPRSMSVPAIFVADDLQNSAPFYVFTPAEATNELALPEFRGQSQLQPGEKWQSPSTSDDQLIDQNAVQGSPSIANEAHPYDRLRPTSAVGPSRTIANSIPNSPAVLGLGEALIVDLRHLVTEPHKRTKSVDRVFATATRGQDISPRSLARSPLVELEEPSSDKTTAQEKENIPPLRPTLRSHFYSEPSYPIFAKPSSTMVRKCIPPPLSLSAIGSTVDLNEGVVHQELPAEPVLNSSELGLGNRASSFYSEDAFELDANEPFQTVLPIAEDIIIHFKGHESEPELEAMIKAFKHGTYPVSMPPLLSELKRDVDQLGTPTTRGSTPESAKHFRASEEAMREAIPIYSPDEYDPFASGSYPGPPAAAYLSKQDISNEPQETAVISATPTLGRTPPPGVNTLLDRVFHDFDTTVCKTAVCVQNSLRSILNVYFPSENTGYHQFNFPLLPELSSLWRPVFREIPSPGSKTTRKIDLILAIGAEKGVNRGLLGVISGSLEKLGRELNGLSRSGRLDLRYLIANAMQAFTSQPLTNQTQDNPFTNPLLLATLIIPHLETYIAAHSTTRFLILEYPAEYLSTVLALQHLIGVDLLKVAGVIDAEASSGNRSPTRHRKTSSQTVSPSSTTSPTKGPGGAALFSRKGSVSTIEGADGVLAAQPSFSKANFILTSIANDSEIATLISTIWKILIDISPSYIPEDATGSTWRRPNPSYSPNSRPTVIRTKEQDALVEKAAVILGFAPSPEDQQQQQQWNRGAARPNYVSSGTYADLPPLIQRPVTPIKSSKASIAETFRSSSHTTTRAPRTPRTTQAQRNKLRHLLGQDPMMFTLSSGSEMGDTASMYDVGDDDENGLFAAEERKYMPLWTHQGAPRNKGNSHKALKWLGLST
ncbi:hypothetical protein F4777DRAFT_588354 [Nemania sp. FL0916]|nr:hypothetical protein F4777DRAFT_588354 [Nemania sp. FL0916]